MNDDATDAMLQTEYFHLQKVVEDFDARALTIKAWSISFSLAVMGGAIASRNSAVLLVSFVSALLFWLLEAMWKSFQAGYYRRIGEIERHFATSDSAGAPLQISRTWFDQWKSGGNRGWLRILFWPHVCLPHLVVATMGLVLFLLTTHGAPTE